MPAQVLTKRLKAAQLAVKAAKLEVDRAARTGDQKRILEAGMGLARAMEQEKLALVDAEGRKQGGRRNSRKDGSPTSEQMAHRQKVLAKLGINEDLAVAPEPEKRVQMGIAVPIWVNEALKRWEEHCAVLGAATIGRWILISTLLKMGKPPQWQGEWPPEAE